MYVYTLQPWLFPSLGYMSCTGSFENLQPKWWRGALFCLNFTVRPMARIFWKGCKVLKKTKQNKKINLLKAKFGKKYKKKKNCCKKWTFYIQWLQACLQWYRTVQIYEKTKEYWNVTSSFFFFFFFFFFLHFTQHFHNHISVEHDEKPSHTKFDMVHGGSR